ncbi:hypothetical protein [Halorarius halobius]|uniref:hypothetical protein n=1 Tax=Halorarius halobius TaxID=2962671 RepID=UPI0020CCBF6A|nr:hypothetical protein [Halorarius halobius]
MHDKIRRVLAALAVAMLLTSAVGAGAAAIAWDTSGTDATTTTSDVDTTTTSIDVYYGDSGNSTWFEVKNATTDNLTLRITPAQDGVDYVVYENTSAETTDATNGHYAFNVSHDELGDAPRDVDGASYDVQVINQTSGDEVLNATGVTFSNAGDDPKAVMIVTDETTENGAAMTSLVADRLTIEEKESGFLGVSSSDLAFWSDDENDSDSVATWSGYTTVDGTNTTVDVVMDNSSAADAYDAAADSTESGEWMTGATIFVNGIPHKVYDTEAPEDAEGTTVVYNPDSDTLTVNPSGEDYEEVRTLNIRGTGNSGYAFGTMWSAFGAWDATAATVPYV